METMDETEENNVINWSMIELIESEETIRTRDALVDAMSEHIKTHSQSTLPSD